MKISILSIGNELLKGTTLNSNAAIIGKEFFKLGITPFFQATVNDSKDEINNVLDYIVSFSDVIIVTGGLGPTKDDLTVKTIADYFGMKLYKDQGVIDNILRIMSNRDLKKNQKIKLSEQNIKQAFVPENSEVFINTNGTAPGICVTKDKKMLFLLPGPPSEMKPILLQKVIPKINKLIKKESILRSYIQ